MIPVIAVVGKTDSGKTTLLEKLVAELKKRGYRVGTVKHDIHGFDVDHPGKDSWRHAQAGADAVAISSPQKLALIKKVDHDLKPDELVGEYFGDVDIVLMEGYKREDKPKIEVFRRELSPLPLCQPQELLFLASNDELEYGVPRFPLEDIKSMVDFMEEKFLTAHPTPETALFVNGRSISLSSFAQRVIAGALLGIISTLKGVGRPQRVHLWLRAEEGQKDDVSER